MGEHLTNRPYSTFFMLNPTLTLFLSPYGNLHMVLLSDTASKLRGHPHAAPPSAGVYVLTFGSKAVRSLVTMSLVIRLSEVDVGYRR